LNIREIEGIATATALLHNILTESRKTRRSNTNLTAFRLELRNFIYVQQFRN